MSLPFTQLDRVGWLRLFTTALWFALGLWLASLTFVGFDQRWGNDMPHFWSGARTWLDGGDMYDRLNHYPGVNLIEGEQFHPLPWVALMFVPLALLPFAVAVRAWFLINVALLLIAMALAYHMGRDSLPAWTLALSSMAMVLLSIRCLQTGQISILLLTTTLMGIEQMRRARWVSSGLWFSFAILKPWVLIGSVVAALYITLAKRQWKFVMALATSTLLTVAITTALWPNWLVSFIQVDFSLASGIKQDGQYVEYWPVTTLPDFLRFVLGWSLDQNALFVVYALLALLVVGLGLAAVWLWHQHQIDEYMLIAIGALLPLLIVPYIRYLDYPVLSIWLIGMLMGSKRRGLNARSLAALGVFIGAPLLFIAGTHLDAWYYEILISYCAASVFVLWQACRAHQVVSLMIFAGV